MPLASASSAMIWSTGLVKPSRSTRGSIAFCTVSAAGYCRAPRPAAVITALDICTALTPYRLRRGDLLLESPRGTGSSLSHSETRRQINRRVCRQATPRWTHRPEDRFFLDAPEPAFPGVQGHSEISWARDFGSLVGSLIRGVGGSSGTRAIPELPETSGTLIESSATAGWARLPVEGREAGSILRARRPTVSPSWHRVETTAPVRPGVRLDHGRGLCRSSRGVPGESSQPGAVPEHGGPGGVCRDFLYPTVRPGGLSGRRCHPGHRGRFSIATILVRYAEGGRLPGEAERAAATALVRAPGGAGGLRLGGRRVHGPRPVCAARIPGVDPVGTRRRSGDGGGLRSGTAATPARVPAAGRNGRLHAQLYAGGVRLRVERPLAGCRPEARPGSETAAGERPAVPGRARRVGGPAAVRIRPALRGRGAPGRPAE